MKSFFAAFCILIATCSPSFGQDDKAKTEKKTPDFVIEKEIAIESFFGGFNLLANLGTLPVDSQGLIKVELVNPHDFDFTLEGFELGCRCTSIDFDFEEIKAHSSVNLNIHLSTKATQRRSAVTNHLTLVSSSDKKKNITLGLRYELAGMMCFAGNPAVQEVDTSLEKQSVMIPFVITKPVQVANVQIGVKPESDFMEADLVKVKDAHFVKVTFDPALIKEDGSAFTVFAEDKVRGLQDETPLLLYERKQLEITPNTIRLRRKEKGQLEGACIVRNRPPSNDSKAGDSEAGDASEKADDNLHLEATLGKTRLKVRSRKIGNGIYRVFLEGPEEKLLESLEQAEKPTIQWLITTSKKRFAHKSPVTIRSILSNVPLKDTNQ